MIIDFKVTNVLLTIRSSGKYSDPHVIELPVYREEHLANKIIADFKPKLFRNIGFKDVPDALTEDAKSYDLLVEFYKSAQKYHCILVHNQPSAYYALSIWLDSDFEKFFNMTGWTTIDML